MKIVNNNKDQEDTLSIVQCEACGNMYRYIDEPQEVKEGGTHICPDCWAEGEEG